MTLILDGVSVRQRGETWLDDIRLELPNGMTTLVGPMTAGKTTLMRVAAGLSPPDSGRVLVDGKDVTGISVRKRSVAFVYQQFINYPSLTVHENIASPLRLDRRFDREGIDRRVREVAELMGIADLLGRRPAELSGGQQQRTAIARALARPVDLLLLDEPLANLDFKLREQLRADLKAMFAQSRSVVLYSTADPNEALSFAAPTVVLGEGRVRHVGEVADMYAHPPTLAVAATLSDPPLNLLPGVVRDGRIECLGMSFPAPRAHVDGTDLILAVRPHQVSITRESPGALALPAEIRLAEVTGSATFLHLLLPGRRHLVAHLPGTQLFTPGESTVVYVDPAHVFVFDATGERLLATGAAEVDLHG
ncbi:ABC transporter ATP-binding protein [Nonomuraea jiangxiensis]|uniref:Glycerol transport system ATP-binding protein n=1 Tax=Nonomuraea jiangxiensis TaxID=633440 RepID=A0A1G8UPD6_9ACTN|nr:ABC transporter ATP-binding protein [Nonomuraea jiangxiensis]SDJ55534.1 glycerol transport system ATP-binding protein [Nonomuraea jiangxiensis]